MRQVSLARRQNRPRVLEVGDSFVLNVLGESLWYQVDLTLRVDPDNLRELNIDPNMDYCTIVTCTPYGINTHRLLVRGVRVDGPDAERLAESSIQSEAIRSNNIFLPILIVITPILFVLLIIQSVRFIWKYAIRKKT